MEKTIRKSIAHPSRNPTAASRIRTRVVRIEVGATDLLDEVRVVFSETSLDLVEDALFVIVQWHPCPPAVGDPTAITDYKEAVPKGGTLDRGGDRGRPRETAAARDPDRAR